MFDVIEKILTSPFGSFSFVFGLLFLIVFATWKIARITSDNTMIKDSIAEIKADVSQLKDSVSELKSDVSYIKGIIAKSN